MSLRLISQLHNFHGKTVLVRIDSDVDFEKGKALDDTRLKSSLNTIKYLLKNGADVILLGHLGRPDGRVNQEYTLEPVVKWYVQEFSGNLEKTNLGDFPGWKIKPNLSLLENLRFYKEEEDNDADFARRLSELGDVFVNEAFAVSHREHTSIFGITKYLSSYAGFHLAREVEELSKILKNPERPLVVLIGGSKIETKLPVVEKMHRVADYVLVGGKIAEETKILIKVQHQKIPGSKSAVLVADNTLDRLDITEKDTENFIQILKLAKTIVWNGPVGRMGNKKTEENSLKIAMLIADSRAYTVVGGGDTLALLRENNLLSKFDFVSTGGGAMLEFLSGKKLPGIKALEV